MANASTIPDELFLVAARTLSKLVTNQNIEEGALYPRLTEIRKLSLDIAEAVAEKAYEMDLARDPKPEKLRAYIEEYIYHPDY